MTTHPVSTVLPVPMPADCRLDDGWVGFSSDGVVMIDADEPLAPAARLWADLIYHSFGLVCANRSSDADTGVPTGVASGVGISFRIDDNLPPSGYRVRTIAEGEAGHVEITARDLSGAFAATQTLRQLAGPQAFRHAPLRSVGLTLPTGTVDDAPRHAWRGVMLDVARHFAPTREVCRFIDLAAAHRLNVVQLHLTDDQGWRFESRHYPELTRVGAWRHSSARGFRHADPDHLPHGGFYTQDDLREIVAYAHGQGVTVIPEIDMPGHVEAALAAYPWLGTGKQPHRVRTSWGISEDVLDPGPEQIEFFASVIEEVCEVFDSRFIHIGGDEVPTTAWRGNPVVEDRARNLGFHDSLGHVDLWRLHGWFLAQILDRLRALGRRGVVWDEAQGPYLPRDAIVMSWQGLSPAARALAAGNDVVLAPEQYLYLDHRADEGPDEPMPVGYLHTVEDVYSFDMDWVNRLPGAEQATMLAGGMDHIPPATPDRPGMVLGMQAQVWTEYLETPRRVDYATFPRLAALAEVAWGTAPPDRGPGSRASASLLTRLKDAHLPRLAAAGVEYRPLEGPLPWQMKPGLTAAPHTRHLTQTMRAELGLP